MDINTNTKEFKVGDYLEGVYLLDSFTVRPIASGRSTIMLANLRDKTGTIGCKIWNYDGSLTTEDVGKAVYAAGPVGEYNGALQVTLDELRLATPEEEQATIDRLVPTAPDAENGLWSIIMAAMNDMQDPDYRKICQVMMEEKKGLFRTIPAGKSVHHAFVRGLLMHTANMVKIATCLKGIYGDFIDQDLLMAGTILHDIGKLKEFDLSPLGLVTAYSTDGQLLGHLVLGAQAVADTARELGMPGEKSRLLQHLLLSHHGEPEFGAAVRPICAEAQLLSYIDLIDSRMESYREQLDKMKVGEVTNILPTFGGRVYKHF